MPESQEPMLLALGRGSPRELLELARTLADALEKAAPDERSAQSLRLARSLALHVVDLLESAGAH